MRKTNAAVQGFIVYRIYYGDTLVYVGRTKQPLQNRIRGHLFSKPMHRTIAIDLVSKIEYVKFETEADMNLYEIYFILKWHPPLNVDDKTRDYPTVELPDVKWTMFTTDLWAKWVQEIHAKDDMYSRLLRRYQLIPEELRVLRSAKMMGEIDEDTFFESKQQLDEELERIRLTMRK